MSASGSIYQRNINTSERDLTFDLTLTLESVLKLDAPFSLRVVQFEHGDSHDKDQNGRDELEYSCALFLKQFNTRRCGELTLPEIFGFLIEVRSSGEPYSDEHGTNYNSNEKTERRAKKDLKSRISDMKYVASAVEHSWSRILRRSLLFGRSPSSSETSRSAMSPLPFFVLFLGGWCLRPRGVEV